MQYVTSDIFPSDPGSHNTSMVDSTGVNIRFAIAGNRIWKFQLLHYLLILYMVSQGVARDFVACLYDESCHACYRPWNTSTTHRHMGS